MSQDVVLRLLFFFFLHETCLDFKYAFVNNDNIYLKVCFNVLEDVSSCASASVQCS